MGKKGGGSGKKKRLFSAGPRKGEKPETIGRQTRPESGGRARRRSIESLANGLLGSIVSVARRGCLAGDGPTQGRRSFSVNNTSKAIPSHQRIVPPYRPPETSGSRIF